MQQVYLGLGSNLGDRIIYFSNALKALESSVGKVVLKSSVYETKAWGKEDEADYLNMVILIETNLKPQELLKETQKIEIELGRQKKLKWGSRTIDIDILFYNNIIFTSETLEIPHPLIYMRKFVLLPLVEIASDFVHPVFKTTIKNLYSNCEDQLIVQKLTLNF
ncbi:MAG: 2-amino-4-hydroxy-6-hydroxymethyldihydropteridine diphosphokinase [Pelobium sp.]